MSKLLALLLMVLISSSFSYPGDTLSLFTLPYAVPGSSWYLGLAQDPADGNVFCAVSSSNNVLFCKFNAVTHELISGWTNTGTSNCNDIGYGYEIAGVKYLVFTANSGGSGFALVNPSDGSIHSYLPLAYSMATWTGGVEVSPTDDRIYLSPIAGGNLLKRSDYPFTAWSDYFNAGDQLYGLAIGWGRLFVIKNNTRELFQYDYSTGVLQQTYHVNGLGGWDYARGLAIGRVNAAGSNESLFLAVTAPVGLTGSPGIHEVEIGNVYTGATIQPTSLGTLRAAYH